MASAKLMHVYELSACHDYALYTFCVAPSGSAYSVFSRS